MSKVLCAMSVVCFALGTVPARIFAAEPAKAMKLTSPDFKDGDMVDIDYTCEGTDVNPPLDISNIPEGTKSLVLVFQRHDARGERSIHWLVYDIPVKHYILENCVPGTQGQNDFESLQYRGPCPQQMKQKENFLFRLYALDTGLGLPKGEPEEKVLESMQGHILASAELALTYERQFKDQ